MTNKECAKKNLQDIRIYLAKYVPSHEITNGVLTNKCNELYEYIDKTN